MLHFLFVLLLQVYAVVANTEKAIFLGPRSLHVPSEHPSLEDLKLEALSPQQWSIRTHIKAEFPTNSSKYGQSSWMLLHKLHEGQRYEVRICWAATVYLQSKSSTQPSNIFSNQLPSAWILMNCNMSSKQQN